LIEKEFIFIYDPIHNPDSNDCTNFSDESVNSSILNGWKGMSEKLKPTTNRRMERYNQTSSP